MGGILFFIFSGKCLRYMCFGPFLSNWFSFVDISKMGEKNIIEQKRQHRNAHTDARPKQFVVAHIADHQL